MQMEKKIRQRACKRSAKDCVEANQAVIPGKPAQIPGPLARRFARCRLQIARLAITESGLGMAVVCLNRMFFQQAIEGTPTNS